MPVMGIKSFFSKYYAAFLVKKTRKAVLHPEEAQREVFNTLIKSAKSTQFGQDHRFSEIVHYDDFKQRVPLREYEGLKPYIDRILEGEENVLWPGYPIYMCKTSGTTSGAKYIPISKVSIHNHIQSAKLALLHYIYHSGNTHFVDGKMIFLQGSPVLNVKGKARIGRLSGIVAHHVPNYLQRNRLPSYTTNCIDDWETKVDKVVEETMQEDMRLISGIPSWVQMYFERLIELSGKRNIGELFKHFSLFVYGGVNFEPYRPIFKQLIGRDVDTVETYPASEGFIAYQDQQPSQGLLLVIDNGIFYEFIPASEYGNEQATRLSLNEVELDTNYAIVLNTNAGLWGYVIGDTVKFVSKAPYRIVVTGRIKHFTSAFGEHVIGEEVESALKAGLGSQNSTIKEFHVAPEVNPTSGLPYHEWFIEYDQAPDDPNQFAAIIDQSMQDQNPYYKDLIEGNILKSLVITPIAQEGFKNAMKQRGKLGGQNKIPRLSNDRTFADLLTQFKL